MKLSIIIPCYNEILTIKKIVEMVLKISNKNLYIDFVENKNSVIDFIFDTEKMNQLLGSEKINIEDGLRSEYK